MTVDDVTALALALPEATEEPHFDMRSFRVRGKIFATLPPDDAHAHVFVAAEDVPAWVAEAPEAIAMRAARAGVKAVILLDLARVGMRRGLDGDLIARVRRLRVRAARRIHLDDEASMREDLSGSLAFGAGHTGHRFFN